MAQTEKMVSSLLIAKIFVWESMVLALITAGLGWYWDIYHGFLAAVNFLLLSYAMKRLAIDRKGDIVILTLFILMFIAFSLMYSISLVLQKIGVR